MPRRAVVVGAGPAGILASIYLAQLGFDEVVVYERREEPSEAQRKSQYSYPIVLSSRAMMAFSEAGVAPACTSEAAGAAPCGGHFANGVLRGGFNPQGLPAQLATWVVDRVGLAADLLAEARRGWPDRIRFVFSASLLELQLAARRAVFALGPEAGGGQVVEEGYELLVGADGASSAVRAHMQAQVPGFSCRTLYRSPVTYKTFHGLPREPPPGAQGRGGELVPGIAAHAPRQYLYWFDHRMGPLVTFWLTDSGRLDGLVSKVTSWDAAHLSARIRSVHPSLPAHLLEGLLGQVAEGGGEEGAPSCSAAASRFGSILQCNRFHGPRCVLVGDAAHAVTGHLGQGANMALESVRLLGGCLRACGGDLDAALPRFSRKRAPDVRSMQHLEMCMAAFTLPPALTKDAQCASATSAGPATSTGPAPSAPFSATFRAYAAALLGGSMLAGAALHRLAPGAFPLPIYLLAAMRDGRRGYGAALRTCRAMLAGTALLAAAGAAGAAALAATVVKRYWR